MKEKRHFSHIDLAHSIWENGIQQNTWAIDATCGNGHDTLFLAQFCSGVLALDIQPEAIEKTRQRVKEFSHVHFYCQSHETFPPLAYEKPISLIVYNLGYLPGGNKNFTTMTSTTLKSLQEAMSIVQPKGLICMTCYPGHPEGAFEEKALLSFTKELKPDDWTAAHYRIHNQKRSPSLLLLQKN